MAGQPAPLSAVQAAVMKQSAARQGQSDPAEDMANLAVKQDLSVMADQAKGYTSGVASGVEVAKANSAAAAQRMAEEKAQEDALRASQLATQQAQTAAAAERARSEQERVQKEAQAAQAGLVINQMSHRLAPGQASLFSDVLGATVDYDDAKTAIENLRKHGVFRAEPIGSQSDMEDSYLQAQFLNYAKWYHDALQGKAVDLRAV